MTRPEVLRVRANVIHRMLSGFLRWGLYGSSRDGTWLPANKGEKYEVDGDFLIHSGFLSEDEQKQYIHYRKGNPGFVYIDLTDMKKSEFEQSFTNKTNLIEVDGKKYLSALESKTATSNMAVLTEDDTSDQRFAHFLSMVNALLPDPFSASSQMVLEGDNTYSLSFHGDLVNCIACSKWPQIASQWHKRQRKWPSRSLVSRTNQLCFSSGQQTFFSWI